MWMIYVFMLIIWWVLLFFVLKREYYLWHFMPTSDSIRAGQVEEQIQFTKELTNKYFEITLYPIIERIINQNFTADIANLIMIYFNSIELDENHIID